MKDNLCYGLNQEERRHVKEVTLHKPRVQCRDRTEGQMDVVQW